MAEGILAGKRGLVMGVAIRLGGEDRRGGGKAGAELAFTYQMEEFGKSCGR